MSNHVGLRPRFIPLKGSSLRRLTQNITPLSVGFAVHKQSRRRAALTHGEIGFPVTIEVGSDHCALLTVYGDATLGSRHGGEVPRTIAAQ